VDQPNVLFIVIDCLRADFVHQRGHARTPTLDRLGEEGFSFSSAIASTTTTTPSFASLITGLYPFQHGVRSHSGYRLSEGVRTLAELLQERGYRTCAELCGPLGPEVGLTRGFDQYNHRSRTETIHSEWGERLLERVAGGMRRPWFVWLHIWSLHQPRQVIPECEDRRFGRTQYGRALSSIDLYLARLLEKVPEGTLLVLTGDHGEEISSSALQARWNKLRRTLYRFMRKRGLTRRHISHALRGIRDGHGHSLYEVLVRVPLVFHCKGLVPPGGSPLQVRHIDIMPTILDLLGLPVPEGITGQSLWPAMQAAGGDHRDAYIESVGMVMPDKSDWLAGIRVANKYKYIYAPYLPGFSPELYDLERDSQERHNIASSMPELAAELRRKIESLKSERMVGERMSEDEQARVMERLKDLGYLD